MDSELAVGTVAETSFSDDFLNQVIDNTKAIRRESDRDRMKTQLNNFLAEVTAGTVIVSSDLIGSIEQRISAIDELLSSQVSLIIHAPEFQKKSLHGAACINWCRPA